MNNEFNGKKKKKVPNCGIGFASSQVNSVI